MPRLASLTSQLLLGTITYTSPETAPEYLGISLAPTTTNEGTTITATVTTLRVTDGVTVGYTVTGVSSGDLSSGSLTGTITINSNTGSATFGIANDGLTEGTDVFTITLAATDSAGTSTLSASASALVNDTSNDPTTTLWLDDNDTATTVRSIIGGTSMQINGVFASNPSVPRTIEGRTSGTRTTITAITARTSTYVEVDDTGNSTNFVIGESLNILVPTYSVEPGIIYYDAGSTRNNLSSGFNSFTLSSSIRADDLLAILVSGNSAGPQNTFVGGTGQFAWTEILDTQTPPNLVVAYKTAVTGDADRSQFVSWDGVQSAAMITLGFRNAEWDSIGAVGTAAGTSTATAPSVTTSANNAVIVSFAASQNASGAATAQSSPWTAIISDFTTGGSPTGRMAVYRRTQALAGASGTLASAFPAGSSGTAGHVQFAVRPRTVDYAYAGDTIVFRVNTTDVPNNTQLYWTTTSTDLVTTSGSFIITDSAGSFSTAVTFGGVTEGNETITVNLRTGSIAGTIVASTQITLRD